MQREKSSKQTNKPKHRVTVVPAELTFEVSEGESILAAGRRVGVWLPFECGWGSCSTCKVTLVKGEIRPLFPEAPAIKPRDRRRKRILACQSTALSDLVIKAKPQPEAPPKLDTQEYRAALLEVEVLATGIHRFRFKLDRLASFLPGQYAIFDLGEGIRRCYSMCNLPGSDEVEFIAKYYARAGTKRLYALAVGDEIAIELPYGAAYLRETSADLVFMAGGTGIAPILSLLRQIVTSGKMAKRRISVFYGAQTPQELVCLHELEALVEKLPEACLVPAVVEAPASFRAEVGFVTDAVSRHLKHMPPYNYYMAGPPPMVNAALNLLSDNNVPITHIQYDSFG